MAAVYGDFDQETLDNEYLISKTVPSLDPFLADYAGFSADARTNLDCREDVSCGDHADQVIDIFPATGKDGKSAPVFVFIHGGYWRMLSHKESSFMAENMVANGIAVVSVNYSLAPEASIDTIVQQCREAIAWTWQHAGDFGGDPDRIFVCGSSAGGHLTGMMVAGGWHAELGVPADVIKGAVPLSGLHDLEPLRHSCINEWGPARCRFGAAQQSGPSPARGGLPADPVLRRVGNGGIQTPERAAGRCVAREGLAGRYLRASGPQSFRYRVRSARFRQPSRPQGP